jgi:hypothetical protein
MADGFTKVQIQGKWCDSKEEYWVALALDKLKLRYRFQVPIFGGTFRRGGLVIDFVVWNPLPIAVQVHGEYWHPDSMGSDVERIAEGKIKSVYPRMVILVGQRPANSRDGRRYSEAKSKMTDKDIEFLKREIGKLNGAHWYFLRLINQDLSEGASPTFDDLTLEGILTLEDTTASDEGVIYKDTTPFIHNFHHPTGGAETPNGHNTFIGENAGNFTTGSTAAEPEEGSENVGIGYRALNSNTTGYNNSAIGASALENNTTGYYNLALGEEALASNTTGFGNTVIGRQAGYSMISGSYNTIIGLYAGKLNTTGSENVFIGNGAGGAETGSNKLYISDSATVTPLIYGEFDTPVLKIHGSLVVNEAGEDYDTRIEGSTDENLVVVDAGNNRLGVGTATPSVKLDVNGDVNMQPGNLTVTLNGDANMYQDVTVSGVFSTDKGLLINQSEGDNDSKLSGTSDENLTYWDAGNDRVGIGTATPSVKLDVNGDVNADNLQDLATTDSPTFDDLTTTGDLDVGGEITINNTSALLKFEEASGAGESATIGIPNWDVDRFIIYAPTGVGGEENFINYNGNGGSAFAEFKTNGTTRLKLEDATTTINNDLDVGGDLTVGGDINLNGYDFKAGTFSSIEDDSFTSFTPFTQYGVLFLYQLAGANLNGIVVFRANASPWGAKMLDTHSVIEIATTSLNGTTGTNGKFTVGITNGTIYLENRLGSTAAVGYFTIGY